MSINDPRETALNDAVRPIITRMNYDPHFSGVEDRINMETRLWLARLDAMIEYNKGKWREKHEPAPIQMILFCPSCGAQHIDAAEPDNGWTNPPHRSHLCHYCNHVWRPADVPTTGVAEIGSIGEKDSPRIRKKVSPLSKYAPEWRHVARGTIYHEIARGPLQNSRDIKLEEGTRMIAIRGAEGRAWFRAVEEFEDGRFERV